MTELTPDNYSRIANAIDRDGVFTKDYTRYVGNKLTVVGLRIGERPNHMVAFFGDTIIRREDGTYTVARADAPRSASFADQPIP